MDASFISLQEVFNIFFRTSIIFLFTLFMLRLLGKRHLSHLTHIDLLLIIALGSAVGDVMIYTESTVKLMTSVAAIAMVAIAVKILLELASRFRSINNLLFGNSRLLVDRGKVIKSALAKEDLHEDELEILLREKGLVSLTHIDKVYVEPDGELSIIMHKRRTRKKK
jgi:uncharacterized membrane protein YcaP (DUF421 family)